MINTRLTIKRKPSLNLNDQEPSNNSSDGATESSKTVPTKSPSPSPFSSPPPAASVDHYQFTCEVEICLTCSEYGNARTQTVSDRRLSLDLISAKQGNTTSSSNTNGENFGVFQGV
jgi:nitrate reductase cytochrome c-type subunit